MIGCIHCYAAVDVRIKKQIKNNNEVLLDIADTYYCLKCGKTVEHGSLCYSSIDEIDELEELALESYDRLCMGDKELIVALYNRIKMNHPNISSDTLLKYICAALYNMENKTVTLERYKKRVLRLGLQPKFNNWSKYSVIHYTE